MENKKTKIAIIIVILLIVGLIVISYFYNDFNTKQVTLLTEEANKILEANLNEDSIDLDIKTEKNYAKVEDAIKDYISELKNIYMEMEELVSGINPNLIFSAQNMPNKNMDKVDEIISEYKEKSQNLISEYEELVTEERIAENISKTDISIRNDYYTNLYNEIMLSDTMKSQYDRLEEKIKNEKGKLYEKLNKIQKMKVFLGEHKDSWIIKDDQVQFTNINRMLEYYNLFYQVVQ